MLARLARLGCALLAAPFFCGCLEATQVDVELTTDVNCADRPETTINVGTLGQLESSAPVAVTTACDTKTGRIGSIVVLPHDSKEGQVGIEIVAGIAKGAEECRRDNFVGGCIVARRSLNFVKHHSLELPIELEAACVDVPCGATETCRKGACVSAEVDPNSCFTSQGCSIVDPAGGSGGMAGTGGSSGAAVGGSSSSGAGPVGGTSGGGNEGQAGDGTSPGGASGSTGQASGGNAGQAASGGQNGNGGQSFAGFAGQGGTAGQASAGFGGQGASAGQTAGGVGGQAAGGIGGQNAAGTGGQTSGGTGGQNAAGTGGQTSGGTGGQNTAGTGGQSAGGSAGIGGTAALGPVLVASDFKASTGSVSTISPTKALLPEHSGDILFAWVCVTSDLGFASPQDSTFWSAYTNAPGTIFLLAKVHCQVFTATATGGSESHAFNVFPSASVSIQRLEFASAKPPPASPPADSGFPTTTPTTSAMTVSQNHSALVYFFGVSGSTTLGAIKIGAGGVSTAMQQITAGGVSQLTSGIAVAYDQPAGTAPKVTYAPASTSVWSSAGVVLSPSP